MELEGKVALITGANRGIGRAISHTFGKHGASVAVTGRNTEQLDRVAGEIETGGGRARTFSLDVSDADQVDRAVKEVLDTWGRIDILVNNAGVTIYNVPVWQATVEQWDLLMAVNLRGMFLCCRAVLPHMVERKTGVVINIGSSSGRSTEGDEDGAYTATKWGVVGYTGSLARSVRPHGVQVNGINPGWVDTDMAREIEPDPSPEWSTPDEIAEAALFLASRAPRDMTGQFVDVFQSY